MEELSTKQFILLNILITVVVSATVGIFTVYSLNKQVALFPPMVNRIIERTVQEVVAGSSSPDVASEAVDQADSDSSAPQTEEQLRMSAVAKNLNRTATVYLGTKKVGDGVVLTRRGVVVCDRAALAGAEAEVYLIAVHGRRYPATLLGGDARLAYFQVALEAGESLTPAQHDDNLVQQGATVYLVSGENAALVAATFVAAIDTSTGLRELVLPVSAQSGALAIDSTGMALGMVVGPPGIGRVVPLPAAGTLSGLTPMVGPGDAATGTASSTQ